MSTEETIAALDRGEIRVAEKVDGEWKVNSWMQQAIAQYGDPDFDAWMTQYPMETSLPAPDQVKAFDIWNKQIGAAK